MDKSQTPYTLSKAQQLGYKKLFIFIDRGYYSLANLKIIDEMQVGFGIMIPDNVEVVSDLIKKYSSIIKMNSKYYIAEFKIYGVQTVITLTDGSNDKHEFYAYVYFDHKRYFDEVEHINLSIPHILT